MTKQNWLFALLIGSSIACLYGADPSSAQNLSGLKWRLHILPNEGGASQAFSMNNQDWVSGFVSLPGNQVSHVPLWRKTQNSQSEDPSWRLTDLGTLGGANAGVASPNKNRIGWLAGYSDTAAPDPNLENFCGYVCNNLAARLPITSARGFCGGRKPRR
jgi:hypothetical protein